MVESKEDFWLNMDCQDISEAGAFVPREIWDKYILKEKKTKQIIMKPKVFK
jgi:hypothetical protein